MQCLQHVFDESPIPFPCDAEQGRLELPAPASPSFERVAVGAESDRGLREVAASVTEVIDVIDLQDGCAGVCELIWVPETPRVFAGAAAARDHRLSGSR